MSDEWQRCSTPLWQWRRRPGCCQPGAARGSWAQLHMERRHDAPLPPYAWPHMTGSSRWLCHSTLRLPCPAPSRSSTRRRPETVGMATPYTGRPTTCSQVAGSGVLATQFWCQHNSNGSAAAHAARPAVQARCPMPMAAHLSKVGRPLNQRRQLHVLTSCERGRHSQVRQGVRQPAVQGTARRTRRVRLQAHAARQRQELLPPACSADCGMAAWHQMSSAQPLAKCCLLKNRPTRKVV